ncbi:MAG TPA: Mur ligase family protein, partial [Bacteroidales bacterium]|nr:Mur ligase family protein [Bacteroidales bacterium]
MTVGIADRDAYLAQKIEDQAELAGIDLHLGEKYLDALNDYSLVIKSPGVGLPENLSLRPGIVITSQTRLMLEAYHRQIIGITGTKGKSTTSSLVHHLLANAGVSSVLVGNIGLPPFDYLDRIGPDTKVVYEMSSHQLEDIGIAPHIAVLLNLFPEHLD